MNEAHCRCPGCGICDASKRLTETKNKLDGLLSRLRPNVEAAPWVVRELHVIANQLSTQ